MAFDAATFTVDPLQLTTPRARLEYLRDFLRALPIERFDMTYWACEAETATPVARKVLQHDCGTVACIGGWTMALFQAGENLHGQSYSDVGDFLGLSPLAALALFNPKIVEGWGSITPSAAADVLDHLIRTGEVDWSQGGATPNG